MEQQIGEEWRKRRTTYLTGGGGGFAQGKCDEEESR